MSEPYFEKLTDEVCHALLESQELGRLAFIGEDGFPIVFPVNYVIDGDAILVHTLRGEIAEYAPFTKVAFEVDHVDAATKTGWSVLVQGVAHDLTGALPGSRQTMLPRAPAPWAPGIRNVSLSIRIAHISGRQLVRT